MNLKGVRDRIHSALYPNSTSLVATPNRPEFDRPFANTRGLRRGMWVKVDGTPGILTGLEAGGLALVQMVEADGTNRMTLQAQPNGEQRLIPLVKPVSAESLKQALLEDIPEPRRPPPDVAARFGYRSKGHA